MHSGLQGKSPCCHEDSSPEVRNQVFQVQFALQKDKRSSLFSSSAESASACGAQKHSCDSPHWRTLSATQVHHQASRTEEMGRDLKCWVNSTKVSHRGRLSSQDIKLGVTVLTAAKEKPCLLPTALQREPLLPQP